MIIITTCVARLASLRRWIGSLGRTALTTLRPHVSRRRQISKSGSSEFSRIMNNILYVYCVLFLSFKIKSNKVTTPRGCPQSVKNNTAQRVTYFSHHDPPTNALCVYPHNQSFQKCSKVKVLILVIFHPNPIILVLTGEKLLKIGSKNIPTQYFQKM